MRRAGGKESFSASPGWHLCLWAGNGPAAALAQLRAVTGQLGFWQDRISTLGSHNSRGQWRTRSVAVIEPACGLRLQLQRTLGYNQQLESNLEEKGDSRAGLRSAHGTTPYPWGPLGQWQTSGECPGFLRWGHAEALAESVRDFLPWSWKRASVRLWRSIMRLLAGWGGTMQWQSCHKEHSMFRVSAPPKPQTPGPSRPVPSGPARSLARVNSRPSDDDGRRIVIWH